MEQEVKNVLDDKKSIRSVCKESNFPKTTLLRCMQKYKDSKLMELESCKKSTIRFAPNYTHKQIFSKEEEEMLKNCLIDSARIHHGLSLKMTKR